MEKKTLLISHTDLDGLGIIVLALYFKDRLNFDDIISEDYEFEKEENKYAYLKKFDKLIFADMSIPEDTVHELSDLGIEVIFFDHHETSKYVKDMHEESVWDIDRCGTKIFWEEFIKPKLSRYNPLIDHFVNLVDTYDLWKNDTEDWKDAKNLNNICMGLKNWDRSLSVMEANERFITNTLNKFKLCKEWRLFGKEKSAVKKAEFREKQMFDKAVSELSVRTDLREKVFGVCCLPSKISIVASQVLSEFPELDYLAIINSWGGITGKISFRSSNKKKGEEAFDCTKLGMANGHFHASAGLVPPEKAVDLLENPNYVFTYKDDYDTIEENPKIIEKE